MIIDCHGHYTTAPKALEDWRNRQIAAIKDPASMPHVSDLKISDDELRHSIESNQLRLMKERGSDVLSKVGLTGKGFKMPHELSGGEQQRVSIARALVNDPEIILADEPTGNLDPQTSEEIITLLLDISKTGRAIVMATHDYLLLNKFKARTITCEEGKIMDSKYPN